jgi:tetraacyldisaccharide 4'-kinase
MASATRNILLPFSALYGGIISIRNFGYDKNLFKSKKLPVPVVSVGNISVGGSGKTPFVMYLIEKVLSLGKKPAVLSRGYKRMTDELVISCPERGVEADVRTLGDEPTLISHNFPNVPVAVQKDRHQSGLEVLKKFGADVFILDDGFQNRELQRDVDFVLLKSSLKDLKDNYLPAGSLRDSRRRINEADIVILTSHGDWNIPGNEFVKNYENIPLAGVSFLPFDFVDHAGQSYPLEMIKGKSIAAFCGIANPEQFFSGLESLNAEVIRKNVFRDHHWFDEYDIDEIFGGDEDMVAITTSKDAARIFLDDELSEKEEVKRIYALREKAAVNFGEENIENALTKVFGEVYA